MFRASVNCLGFCFLLIGVVGCGSSVPKEVVVPVSGTVMFDGKPPEGAAVIFTPYGKNKTAHMGSGVVDSEGQFEVKNFQGKIGIPEGDYIVTVSWLRGPGGEPPEKNERGQTMGQVEMIPSPWNNKTKAGRHNMVTVPADGKSDFEFKIPKVMSDGDVIRGGGPNVGARPNIAPPGGAKALGGPNGAGGPRAGN